MNSPRKSRTAGKQSEEETEAAVDAVELLKSDHRAVDRLLERCCACEESGEKERLLREAAVKLSIHTLLEEQIFYAACQEKGVESEPLDQAQVEHDTVKLLIEELLDCDAEEDRYFDAKVTVLRELVKHHVEEEERDNDGIFARARAAGLDMTEIGQRLSQLKRELTRRDRYSPPRLELHSFHIFVEEPEPRRYRQEEDRGGREYREDYYRGGDYGREGYRREGHGEQGRPQGGRSSFNEDLPTDIYGFGGRGPGDYGEDRYRGPREGYRGSHRSEGPDYGYRGRHR